MVVLATNVGVLEDRYRYKCRVEPEKQTHATHAQYHIPETTIVLMLLSEQKQYEIHSEITEL